MTQSAHGFMPHGMCYLWRPEILWLHVGSDAVTALAYFSIPAAMMVFAHRRPDLAYRPVVFLFTAFILLCGTTHLFSIWTVWTPDYFAEGIIKMLTAAASLATAIALWPLLPRALALPSHNVLEAANADLRGEVARRSAVEAALKGLTSELEARVGQRSAELERANDALRQFAGAASHDLRAPVRHISVFTELLERDEASGMSEAGRETLGRIRTSAERMQTLIDGLLEYARLVNTPPNIQPLEAAELARAAFDSLVDAGEAADARLELGELPPTKGDPLLIERVFDNLISNALKYRGSAAPVITISGVRRDDGWVEIAVADNGPGVPADQAEAIFEMLRRLSGEQPGLGVGLAFCRIIVDSHGGSIHLDTQHQGGARFVFTVPGAS